MNAFSLHILTAFKPFFDGKCLSLVVPTPSGMYGIQAKHSDFVGSIVPGEMKITCEEDGEIKVITAAVADGIVRVEGGDVLVLADTVERAEEIDENRAQAAYERRSKIPHSSAACANITPRRRALPGRSTG